MSLEPRFKLFAAIANASDGKLVPKKSTVVISRRTPPSSSVIKLKSPIADATLPS